MPICVGRDLKGIRRRFCKLAAILGAEEANSSDTVFLVPSAMICNKRDQDANTYEEEAYATPRMRFCCLQMCATVHHSIACEPKLGFSMQGCISVSSKQTHESVRDR